jgi:hypothetical protein
MAKEKVAVIDLLSRWSKMQLRIWEINKHSV